MLFSSTTFLYIFLPLMLAAYFICPKKGRNLILFLGSILFYAWGEPRYILVMLSTIFVNYALALICGRLKDKGNLRGAKLALWGTILFSVGMLAFFKYANFFLDNTNHLLGTNMPLLNVVLPLGISFYTFQTLSYTIDVYRGVVKPQKNILHLATYVCLFPQLIAGPIVRYETVVDELSNRRESFAQFGEGVRRFTVGLGKKVLLANTAGSMYELFMQPADGEMAVMIYWLASFAYSFQIYFDFSGYSDMAIGLGKMFGFNFLENFNYPYMASSITDYWRRWHISLSSWFRDYIYIPLGGNRKGTVRTYVNLLIVWGLTGFWHGAAWNFILWGLFFYIFLVMEKMGLGKGLMKVPRGIRHLYTLFIVNMSWVIFAYDSLGSLGETLKSMFGFNGLPFWNHNVTYNLFGYGISFLILIIASMNWGKRLCGYIGKKLQGKYKEVIVTFVQVIGILIVFFLSTSSLASDAFNPFLYFRF